MVAQHSDTRAGGAGISRRLVVVMAVACGMAVAAGGAVITLSGLLVWLLDAVRAAALRPAA